MRDETSKLKPPAGWNVKQAAVWSGIGENSLRAMAKAGTIPCVRLGRRVLIPRLAFVRWFNDRKAA